MTRSLARVFTGASLIAVALLVDPAPAGAHPLGLPSIARITATGPSEVTIRWNAAADDVSALAHSLGVAGTGGLTREQDAAFARSAQLREAVRTKMRVVQVGRPCAPHPNDSPSVITYGLTVAFRCDDAIDVVTVSITLLHDIDTRYRTLAGATGPTGQINTVFTAAAPEHELQLFYTPANASTPTTQPSAPSSQGVTGKTSWLDRPFIAAIDSRTGLLASAIGIVIAFGVGMVHALAPGHGKAIAASYLVAEGARARHAMILGASVALMHTASVLALGFTLYFASQQPDTVALTRWIEAVTGATFALLGAWLLRQRVRIGAVRRTVDEHTHTQPDTGSSAGWKRVVVLGAAGGLLPSPSALLVLLTALALGRVSYGLGLVAAFSAGLATSLAGIGLAVMRGRDVANVRMAGRLHALVHAAPVLGASVVVIVGTLLFGRAVLQLA